MAKPKRIIESTSPNGEDTRGPTRQRLAMAADAFVVGDDRQGTRVYFLADAPLQRLYTRLRLKASTHEEDDLRVEHAALVRYQRHWYQSGLQPSLPSVDLNRVYASNPSQMTRLPNTVSQEDHRRKFRAAVDHIGHKPSILLDNFVCYEHPLHVAGYSIGYSLFRARRMVRDSAGKLARFWGIG